MREIILKSDDGIKVAVNHYMKNDRQTVMIICPGWFMCKDANAFKSMSEDLFEYVDIVTMDFRGHGKSSGFFTFSAKEVNDLKTVVKYVKSEYKKVILLGFSLGAATVINYTSEYNYVDSIIAVSPPTEFDRIEYHIFKKEAVIPTLKKFELWRCFTIRPGNMFLKKPKPIELIDKISPIPMLILAGEKDPTVYPWHAESLFEKAGDPKQLEIFEGGKHAEDLYLEIKDKFMFLVTEHIKELIG